MPEIDASSSDVDNESGGKMEETPVANNASSVSQSMQKEILDFSKIEKRILGLIPEDTAKKYKMAPVSRNGQTVQVIMTDARNIEALNVLRFLAKQKGLQFSVSVVPLAQLNAVLTQYETTEKVLKSAIETLQEENTNEEENSENIEGINSYQDAPVAKLVETIIQHAIEGKASDIHIEPVENEFRVRYRVDGVLHASLTLPVQVGKAVVARIKILANLKIDEKRKPQDGRFRIKHAGSDIDFRVSSLPVIEGEKVVMRVLDKDSGLVNLSELGLMGRSFEIFEQRIRDPFGIILLTGPTGSGKSTTLYGFLKILNNEETNIITLEDPVEYFIEGLNQSQIKPEIGYTFASGLRSVLRQDPNIIMVGEIRDAETAELAIHAALTGHLVLSTLHTNDAIGSIPRLIDMGIESFLLSASLRAVGAQRLVRRICEKCKEKIQFSQPVMDRMRNALKSVSPEEMKKYNVHNLDQPIFYRGKGCNACGNTGYKGRIAIYEIVNISPSLQSIIVENVDIERRFREQAEREGMITMKQDGILKALLGFTTLDEVERITEGGVAVGSDFRDDEDK